MKNTAIRNQCAYMIRHIRRNTKGMHIPSRSKTTKEVFRLLMDCTSLQDVIDNAKAFASNVDFCDIYFDFEHVLDHEGYYEAFIIGQTELLMTDTEYHDYLCSLILPSEYEMNEYKQYLMLKQKYEGEF